METNSSSLADAKSISGEPIFQFEVLDIADLSESDHLDKIFSRQIDGIVVRNVLTPTQISSLINGFQSIPITSKVQRPEVSLYPRGFPAYLDNTECSLEKDLLAYFSTSEEYVNSFVDVFGFDFHEVLKGVIDRISKKYTYQFQTGIDGNGFFTPSQFRCFLANLPALPVHCGKVFQKMYLGFYSMLNKYVEVSDQVSFFIMLQKPTSGGTLDLYDVPWNQDQSMHPFESIKMQDGSILNVVTSESVRKMVINPFPGDMVIFMGSDIWHSVQGFSGSLDRITVGGFLGPSKSGDRVVSWS